VIVLEKKGIITYPVKEMLDKRKRGKIFKYSGHYKAFSISSAYVKDIRGEFENVITKDIKISDRKQLTLIEM